MKRTNRKGTPEEQLQYLEDRYAKCLIRERNSTALTRIWERIKKVRKELGLPIYLNVTEKEYRK